MTAGAARPVLRRGRRRGRAAAPLVAAIMAGTLTAAGLAGLWLAPPGADLTFVVVAELVLGAGFCAAGAAASARRPGARPEDPARVTLAGWLFLGGGLLVLGAPLAGARGAGRLAATVATLGTALVLPLGLLQVSRRSRARGILRAVDLVCVAAGIACTLAMALGRPGWSLGAALAVGLGVFCAGWLQFELTAGDDRRQLLWLVLGVCLSVPASALFLLSANPSGPVPFLVGTVLALLLLPLPLCAGIAVVSPRVTDVRGVISRLTVAAVMLTITVAVSALALSTLQLTTGQQPSVGWTGVVATAVAAGFHPVLVRVRTSVDELLFGGRADPVDALTRLGTELSAGSSPTEWLAALRTALAVPGVELHADGVVLAAAGEPSGEAEVTPLRVGAEQVGDLVVSLPADQLRLPATTRAVLRLVAGPLAQAVHATRLADRLRASRASVVAALEEERRRIRRDLHDGLGPTLSGIAYSADAAANLVGTDPGAASGLLRDLRADAADGIAEIRRIVEDLRPRALDELGLVAAVRQQVSRFWTADGRRLRVRVEAPAELPPLPAAVEVVAYRVAVEAVTNVARHAGVDTAEVEFAICRGGLQIVVGDAGPGPAGWRPGVGVTTMRQRVEDVAGEFGIEAGTPGTTVRAVLPLAPAT